MNIFTLKSNNPANQAAKNLKRVNKYITLGSKALTKGDNQGALDLLGKCLEIREKASLDDQDPIWASVFSNLGVALSRLGHSNASLDFHKKSLRIQEAQDGKDGLETAASHNNVGLALKACGDVEGAFEHLNQSRVIREAKLDANDPEIAESYFNIGTVLLEIDDFEGAAEMFNKCVLIQEQALGMKDLALAATYEQLAATLEKLGDIEGALDYHYRCLEVRKTQLKKDDPSVLKASKNIGRVLDKGIAADDIAAASDDAFSSEIVVEVESALNFKRRSVNVRRRSVEVYRRASIEANALAAITETASMISTVSEETNEAQDNNEAAQENEATDSPQPRPRLVDGALSQSAPPRLQQQQNNNNAEPVLVVPCAPTGLFWSVSMCHLKTEAVNHYTPSATATPVIAEQSVEESLIGGDSDSDSDDAPAHHADMGDVRRWSRMLAATDLAEVGITQPNLTRDVSC
ncbi:Tetratricopeptide repeat protein [Seminavis robusta]|uniref:Tetratricopeptide repeat protein n=1 Tax=Seminavis robusta TaxID=568900 RepID=A0A9N8HY81_9STRA|nr:Tetratricopeptide repeat protein [Seminavis robusta]|eukprot:Sro2777_g336880.1 Tetratricopeptide repeat protein (463) ;mRNA; r:5296-6684